MEETCSVLDNEKQKVVAILQARMSSSRLPGKVMQDVLGEPMIVRQWERITRSGTIGRFVLATSDHASDDPLARLAEERGIPLFRGNLADVLDRFYQAAKREKAEHVVRLTADCPLADASLIDEIVRAYWRAPYDYFSNSVERTFADGLDVEVFPMWSLEAAWEKALAPFEREHVTPFLWRRPWKYYVGMFLDLVDRSKLRWTVDRSEDLEFVRRVYNELYPGDPGFTWQDVLKLLTEKPEIAALNATCGNIDVRGIPLRKVA